MSKTNKSHHAIWVDPKIAQQLKLIAAVDDKSLGQVVNEICLEYISINKDRVLAAFEKNSGS